MIYKAWVPNVAGRLSFSHIGPTTKTANGLNRTVTHPLGVDIICVDQRNSSDTTRLFSRAGQRILDWWKGKQGEYVFLAVGSSDSDFECLSGRVFKFTLKNWQANVKGALLLDGLTPPEEASEIAQYRALVSERLEKLTKLCGYNGNHSAKFRLWRNGELRIELDEDYSFEARPNDAASSVFRFFREICHRHQHHAARSDVILDCYKSPNDGENWKREALYSMMRYVIMSKRSRYIDEYESALGVVAYAETFHRIFINPNVENPLYNFAELKDSIGVSLAKESRRVAKKPSWIATASFLFAAISLALLTLRSSFGIVSELPEPIIPRLPAEFEESGEWQLLSGYAEVFLHNPISTVAAILIACFISTYAFHSFSSSRLNNWSLEFIRLFLADYNWASLNFSFLVRLASSLVIGYLAVTIIATGFATILGDPGFQFVWALFWERCFSEPEG